MAKLQPCPSNQYRYEHYNPISGVPIRSKKSGTGGMNCPKAGLLVARTAEVHQAQYPPQNSVRQTSLDPLWG